MEAYIKISKELLKMNLSLKELGLIVKLLYIEDYREYKNETNDGWFIKSKRELANELKTDVRRLNTIIDSLIEKGLVECEVVPDRYTKFKINRSQNDITNRSQNDITNRSQNDTLHNNINNNKNKTISSSTSNKYNLNNNIEKNNINNNLDINNKNINKEKENLINIDKNIDKEVISSTSTSSNNSDERDNIQPLVEESSNKTGADSLNYYNEIKTSSDTGITKSLMYQVMENCKILANTNRDNWSDEDNETYAECIVQYKNKYGYNYDVAQTAIDNIINSYINHLYKNFNFNN